MGVEKQKKKRKTDSAGREMGLSLEAEVLLHYTIEWVSCGWQYKLASGNAGLR